MTHLIAALFITPIPLTGIERALLIVPLCLSISVVYKVTRIERLTEVPAAAGLLCITIVVGMYAVGVGLWAVYTLFT